MADLYFQEWRIAERAASAAARAVALASIAAIEGLGPEPGAVMVSAAARLRDLADDLFTVSMANSKARAEQLKRY